MPGCFIMGLTRFLSSYLSYCKYLVWPCSHTGIQQKHAEARFADGYGRVLRCEF